MLIELIRLNELTKLIMFQINDIVLRLFLNHSLNQLNLINFLKSTKLPILLC
jgi:hypothetical protein